jgi:hypothetical protein
MTVIRLFETHGVTHSGQHRRHDQAMTDTFVVVPRAEWLLVLLLLSGGGRMATRGQGWWRRGICDL